MSEHQKTEAQVAVSKCAIRESDRSMTESAHHICLIVAQEQLLPALRATELDQPDREHRFE